MSAIRRAARVASLEARQRAAKRAARLDEDIYSMVPPWWRVLTDDELTEIAQMEFDRGAEEPRSEVDRLRYRAIERACKQRAKRDAR